MSSVHGSNVFTVKGFTLLSYYTGLHLCFQQCGNWFNSQAGKTIRTELLEKRFSQSTNQEGNIVLTANQLAQCLIVNKTVDYRDNHEPTGS